MGLFPEMEDRILRGPSVPAPMTPPEPMEWALPYPDFISVMGVNPGFGGQTFILRMLEKFRRIRQMTDLPVEVDGGISAETAPLAVEAGPLVVGPAVYKGQPVEEVGKTLEAGRGALTGSRRGSA